MMTTPKRTSTTTKRAFGGPSFGRFTRHIPSRASVGNTLALAVACVAYHAAVLYSITGH